MVEIDAVTGEMLDQEYYKSDHYDLCPPYQMYTLHRTWARMMLDEIGAIQLAGLAVLNKYGNMALDKPEDELPIWNEQFWKPDVIDLNVHFIAQMDELPDYIVKLNQDGIPDQVNRKHNVKPTTKTGGK